MTNGRTIEVKVFTDQFGERYSVGLPGQTPNLVTAGTAQRDLEAVEQHVRSLLGRPNPAELLARAMYAAMEQVPAEVANSLQEALIEAGYD